MNKIEAEITAIHEADGVMIIDLAYCTIPLSALLIKNIQYPDWFQKGKKVSLIFKETEVSLAIEYPEKISIRNKFPGKIEKIEKGKILSQVYISIGESIIVSAITTRSVESLCLEKGMNVTALVKANELSLISI